MKIDPDCLRKLRQQKGLSRPQLAERAKITARTIQRLENEPQRTQKSQEHTLNGLSKALNVEPGVLTGDLPLPESDDTLIDNLDRVQMGAQVAPKTRLAYDLIKRRYGVNATEIINMAPLFFTLLAEGSLAWRREKLEEAKEAYQHLLEIDGFWGGGLSGVQSYMDEEIGIAEDSIDEDDLFGDQFNTPSLIDSFFDPSADNPFAQYLRKLADKLAIPEVVDVDEYLNFRSQYKFPDYEVGRKELDYISNGSSKARRTLETGCARISEIPEKLMAEDAQEERTKWLEERLPEIFKEIPEKENVVAKFIATSPQGDKIRDILVKANSQKTNSETEKEGDDE